MHFDRAQYKQKGHACRPPAGRAGQAGVAPILILVGIVVIVAIVAGAYYLGK